MKIYNLPKGKDFAIDIMDDLKRAKKVVLISPFLSINVIKEWREASKDDSSENFTIVYDIDESPGREAKGLSGKNDEELITSITWKRCKHLHSKIYYFEFDEGYSFYHGSANLTNFGVGNIEKGNEGKRNIEIMSRITSNTILNKNIQNIIETYIENSVDEVPYFDVNKNSWSSKRINKPERNGILREYKKLLRRLEPDTTYEPANSNYILGINNSNLTKVQGFFISKNNKMLKFHTTNIKGNKAEFSISWEELRWFTGEFFKINSKTNSRKLYLVWKLDGTFDGKLIVFKLYPIDIFNLLKKSNRSKKIYFPYKSLALSINKVKGKYKLIRYSSCVVIPKEQVRFLDALEPQTSSSLQSNKVEIQV